MSLDIALLSIKEEHKVKAFMNEILSLPPLRGEEWNITSPEITQEVWQRVVRMTKDEDPLREIKAEQNRKALGSLQRCKRPSEAKRRPLSGSP